MVVHVERMVEKRVPTEYRAVCSMERYSRYFHWAVLGTEHMDCLFECRSKLKYVSARLKFCDALWLLETLSIGLRYEKTVGEAKELLATDPD